MARGEGAVRRQRLVWTALMTCGVVGVLPAPPAAAETAAAETELSVSVTVGASPDYYDFRVDTADGQTLSSDDLLLHDGGTASITVAAVRPGAVPVVTIDVCPGKRLGFVAWVRGLVVGQHVVVAVAEPDGPVLHREIAVLQDGPVRIKHCERL